MLNMALGHTQFYICTIYILVADYAKAVYTVGSFWKHYFYVEVNISTAFSYTFNE